MVKKRSLILIVLNLLLLITLAGCFASRPEDIEAFKRPWDVVVSAESYVLQPPDEIEIHCSKVPEIHLQRQRIRPDGNVTFENLGDIYVAGKTPEQVAEILRTKVLALYALPGDKAIDVRIAAYRSKTFYVLGRVTYPGPKVYTGRDTAFSAIARALPNILAWEEHTQIIRPSTNKGERAKIFELDFNRMMKRGDLSKDVLLQEGDIIYVPPTVLAAIAEVVEEFVRPIGRAFSTVYVVQRAQGGDGGGRGY